MYSLQTTWLLPLWILGIPLLLAVIDRARTPKTTDTHRDREPVVMSAVPAL